MDYNANLLLDGSTQNCQHVKGVHLLLVYNDEQMCLFEENLNFFSQNPAQKYIQYELIGFTKITDITNLVKTFKLLCNFERKFTVLKNFRLNAFNVDFFFT